MSETVEEQSNNKCGGHGWLPLGFWVVKAAMGRGNREKRERVKEKIKERRKENGFCCGRNLRASNQ